MPNTRRFKLSACGLIGFLMLQRNKFDLCVKTLVSRLLIIAPLLALGAAHGAPPLLNIVFIPKSSDQVFWDLMRGGVDQAVAEEGNISLTWRGPAYNDDTDSQIRILQLYIKPGVDAIILTPTDRTRLVDAVKKVVQQGIKLIVVDSGIDGHHEQNFITTDNFASGQLAAQQLATLLGGKGRVLVFRTIAGSASTDDRAAGFLTYMKTHVPGIRVVADAYGGGSAGKARHSASALLKQHPDIDGLFAVNESTTDGMLRALRESGHAGKPRFIGFDATEFLLQGLEQKDIDGLIIQDPHQMGYLAIKAAVAAIRKTPLVPDIIHTQTVMVTRDNYKQADIRKMMCVRC